MLSSRAGSRMSATPRRLVVLLVLLVALAQQGDQQPTFRAGINYVAVDVIVTRRDAPVVDLTRDDFEVFEDGKPQPIEQFRMVRISSSAAAAVGAPPPRRVRSRDDELMEAGREDVRIF